MADNPMGRIGWTDLTVADADHARDFYAAVCGWTFDALPMDGGAYHDYVMKAPDGTVVAGVCHARGPNAAQPAQWMNYVSVPDLAASLAACRAGGGQVVRDAMPLGEYGTLAVVQDPAGAVLGLIQPPSA